MKPKILIITLLSYVTVNAQSLSPAEYPNYEGYYGFRDDRFEDFQQFELHVSMSKDSTPVLTAIVVFYLDSSVTSADTTCWTSAEQLYVSRDSLYFRSQECSRDAYEFRGRFLQIPSESDSQNDEPVLGGILTHIRNGTVIKQHSVTFSWIIGC